MPRVVVDCFQESAVNYHGDWALVAIDVIRASTTAVTAVSTGRRCLPAATLGEAGTIAAGLHEPLLAGELGGNVPYGFDLGNSPADVATRTDIERPLVLLSTTGTGLMTAARGCAAVYVSCLRNYSAQVVHLASAGRDVAVVGAGTRGEFRDEDQLGCALVAGGLIAAGFTPAGSTAHITERWAGAPIDAVASSKSAEYLRRTGQERDLDFILSHVDDLEEVYELKGDEIVGSGTA
jgi:2-phosphosulfolactate phosphatase